MDTRQTAYDEARFVFESARADFLAWNEEDAYREAKTTCLRSSTSPLGVALRPTGAMKNLTPGPPPTTSPAQPKKKPEDERFLVDTAALSRHPQGRPPCTRPGGRVMTNRKVDYAAPIRQGTPLRLARLRAALSQTEPVRPTSGVSLRHRLESLDRGDADCYLLCNARALARVRWAGRSKRSSRTYLHA